ncbi:MAG: hypothetical protein KTV77_03275 [Wolbachia endosymbiont of Fragariocoptes setiger]|nr:hypothetical protein [Wolbachia endosymbiont of Fragariocoptes setiger]
MTGNGQEDEFMKEYMKTCKEQIEKLANDPELLNQTLRPFMEMSQQLMTGGVLGDSATSKPMISKSSGMTIETVIPQISEMINYIKENHKDIVTSYELQDEMIQNLDEYSKRFRSLVKKLIEKFDNK